ncbi:Imm51 family immunity protein [Myroides sp. N17-2]|uniref:Imm51 family immunity protein n=1 Tax=Myroides sp. N17-2 TaxID=2030799 RepID=UPI000EFCC11A|nr:Imm51 family immunity protein [Myroides sp. N17-2]
MAKRNRKIELKTGDIIRITLDSGNYAFARVIAKNKLGDIIEVFKYITNNLNDYEKAINCDRLHYPNIIDSYSIFYIGKEGFDIIREGDDSYVPKDYNDLKYRMGAVEIPRLIYLDGREEKIESFDNSPYPWYGPQSSGLLKGLIEFWIEKLDLKVHINQNILPNNDEKDNEIEVDNILEITIEPFKYAGDSVILTNLSYKKDFFDLHSDKGFLGNGYDWQSLAKTYIHKFKPQLSTKLNFDSEADMFSIISKEDGVLEEFIIGFKQACEDNLLFNSLFIEAKIN